MARASTLVSYYRLASGQWKLFSGFVVKVNRFARPEAYQIVDPSVDARAIISAATRNIDAGLC